MRTIKRNVNEIDTSLSSYNKSIKYANQLEWKGIVENKNIYTVDQHSQSNAKNIYVDSHGTLVSRDPLLDDPLTKEVFPDGYKLKDIVTYGKVKVYVTIDTEDLYRITIDGSENTTIEGLTKYHLSAIDNYIICFNDIGAKVLDINNITLGWKDLSEYVEIPVLHRTVGSETTTYVKNQFTNSYIDEYIWSNNSQPILPKGDAKITVQANGQIIEWNLTDAKNLTDYRILKPIPLEYLSNDLISIAKGIICIGRKDYVLISYDGGNTFNREWYPSSGKFLRVASISDDGTSYFFVASDGVYRLNLGTKVWNVFYVHDEPDKKIGTNWITGISDTSNSKLWHFLSSDIFAFVLWSGSWPEYHYTGWLPVLWCHAPGIAGYDSIPIANARGDEYSDVSPEMKENEQIDIKYRGTLGCSIAFCRDRHGGTSSMNEDGSPLQHKGIGRLYEDKVQAMTYLKIQLDNGMVPTYRFSSTPTPDSTPTYVNSTNKDFATIIIGYSFGRDNTQGREWWADYIYILPGSTCCDYIYNNNTFTLALDYVFGWNKIAKFNKPLDSNDVNMACIGKFPKSYETTYINYNIINGVYINDDELYTGFGRSIGLVLDKVSVLRYNTDTLSTEKNGHNVYQISGKICQRFDDNNIKKDGWYDFTWTIGREDTSTAKGFINKLQLYTYYTNFYTPPLALTNSIGIDYTSLYIIDNNAVSKIYIVDEFVGPFSPDSFGPFTINCIYRDDVYYYIFLYKTITDPDTGYLKTQYYLYTNSFTTNDSAQIKYTYLDTTPYTEVPDVSYSSTELYLGFNNKLSITANTKKDDTIKFNLPELNDQSFIENISNIINISTTEVALFFEDNIIICSKVEDENLGFRYDYYPTKLSTGTRKGDSVINTLEGSFTIFPTKRGLAIMNYQAFMATTDQVLTYITDNIEDRYDEFYKNSTSIKIIQMREHLYITNGTKAILIYNLNTASWWYWEVPVKITKMLTNQLELKLISDKLCVFREHNTYKDFPFTENEKRIEWFIISQPMHMNAPNYYKNLKQLVFQLLGDTEDNKQHSITVQIQCYRKRLSTKEPELITFKIEELRTFVKRFNYWKINEIQYGLADDFNTVIPTKLKLNGISVKYELGEEVR